MEQMVASVPPHSLLCNVCVCVCVYASACMKVCVLVQNEGFHRGGGGETFSPGQIFTVVAQFVKKTTFPEYS